MSEAMPRTTRVPLSRHRVLVAAVALADHGGIEAVTMRRLARELGVEAMSLYHHVANKDDLLDGMVDTVFAEIQLPDPGEPWRTAMRRRAESARDVLRRHPWSIALIDTRASPGPATLRHHESVLANLRSQGFSVALAAHAVALLDSYVYGFVLQEVSLPFSRSSELAEAAEAISANVPAEEYPHLAEMFVDHALQPGYDFADEFPFGLELVLDGLQGLIPGSGVRTAR